MWWISSYGLKSEFIAENSTSGEVFSLIWKGCSEAIVTATNNREEQQIIVKDLNLYLVSLLVLGLNSQPTIRDYFTFDSSGLSGNSWMQKHFTEESWTFLNAHSHFDPNTLISLIRNNRQKLWNLNRQLVVDEMMIPFTERWKCRQHVKGKPHDTGI